jgi:xanthine dehydrogenase YagS FAD-binding subunit
VREAVDFAIVSVASVITEKGGKWEDARIVLGAVAPAPFRAVEAEQAIKGKPMDRSNAEAAAEAAVADAVPLSKNAYKVAITRTLVKRALASGIKI